MPLPPHPISTVIVKVRGSAPTYNPLNAAWRHAIWADVVATPATPIAIGQKLQLMVAANIPEGPYDEDVDPPNLELRSLGVTGRVTAIRAIEKWVIEFVVENDIERSVTEIVYLAAAAELDKTVKLSGVHRATHLLASWAGRGTRRLPTPCDELEEEVEAGQ